MNTPDSGAGIIFDYRIKMIIFVVLIRNIRDEIPVNALENLKLPQSTSSIT